MPPLRRDAPVLLMALLGCASLHTVEAIRIESPRAARSGTADDVLSRLWDGEDLTPGELELLRETPAARFAVRRAVQASAALVQEPLKLALLGPFDTGTNLLLHTLELNYPDLVTQACSWDSRVIDGDRKGHCRVWKHGINISDSPLVEGVQPFYTVLERQGVGLSETVLVMVIRNPIGTILSWNKAPYNLGPCLSRSFSSFGSPCSARHMSWKDEGQPDADSTVHFASTVDAYNRYLRMYQNLKADGRLRGAVLLTYEDLVYDPANTVSAVADAIGWPSRDELSVLEAPAKKHGAAVGRAEALHKLTSRSWLQDIDGQERRMWCGLFDKDALGGLVENSNAAPGFPQVPYGADCDGF